MDQMGLVVFAWVGQTLGLIVFFVMIALEYVVRSEERRHAAFAPHLVKQQPEASVKHATIMGQSSHPVLQPIDAEWSDVSGTPLIRLRHVA